MRYRYLKPARATGILVLATGVTALCGCTVGPNFHTPAAPDTDRYVAGAPIATLGTADSRAQQQTVVADQDIPAQWWDLFHSAPLDALVRTSLHDSPTIVAAEAALRAAQQG